MQNERYTGNQKLQKEYITDHITHKRTKNNGEVESYWVTGVAPEIVDLETYKKVQEIIQWKRDTNYKASQSDHPFARRLICADCGATYRRNIKRRGDYEYISWYCRKNDKGKCHSEHWAEEKLKETITELLGWTTFDGDRFKREVNQVVLGTKEIRILRKDGTEICQER